MAGLLAQALLIPGISSGSRIMPESCFIGFIRLTLRKVSLFFKRTLCVSDEKNTVICAQPKDCAN